MKILAVECSAGPASAAIIEDGKILSQSFVNVKMTHSQTLMPMIEGVLKGSLTDISDIGGLAVAAGPGSFTGIRIGIAAVKGIAAPKGVPCAAVSTLRAMAEGFKGRRCIVCAVMDARCNQVYNALFEVDGQAVKRLCEDRALMCEELKGEIKNLSDDGREIIIVGDGCDLFYPYVSEFRGISAAYEPQKYQNAAAVGLCSEEIFRSGDTVSPEELLPVYLRLPQAERELKAKQLKEK